MSTGALATLGTDEGFELSAFVASAAVGSVRSLMQVDADDAGVKQMAGQHRSCRVRFSLAPTTLGERRVSVSMTTTTSITTTTTTTSAASHDLLSPFSSSKRAPVPASILRPSSAVNMRVTVMTTTTVFGASKSSAHPLCESAIGGPDENVIGVILCKGLQKRQERLQRKRAAAATASAADSPTPMDCAASVTSSAVVDSSPATVPPSSFAFATGRSVSSVMTAATSCSPPPPVPRAVKPHPLCEECTSDVMKSLLQNALRRREQKAMRRSCGDAMPVGQNSSAVTRMHHHHVMLSAGLASPTSSDISCY